MSAQGVFTPNLRLTFVKGWLTGSTPPSPLNGAVECGSGLEFSMEVLGASIKEKFDTIAEVFYRVKDAKFGGTAYSEYGFATLSMHVKDEAMPVDYYSGTTSDLVIQRSYANTDVPPANYVSEYDIWRGPHKTPVNDSANFPGGSTSRGVVTHGIVTGLTHYAESYEVSSGYYPYGNAGGSEEWAAAMELAFNGYVAWVNVSNDGNLLNPTNRFFIGVQFQAFTEDYKLLAGGFSPSPSPQMLLDAYSVREYSGNEGLSGTLSVILQSGTLSVPLYSSLALFVSTYSAFTITAQEWWPYDRNTTLRPIWETETGIFIPVGVPFLDGGDAEFALQILIHF